MRSNIYFHFWLTEAVDEKKIKAFFLSEKEKWMSSQFESESNRRNVFLSELQHIRSSMTRRRSRFWKWPQRNNPDPGSAKVNAPAELLRGQIPKLWMVHLSAHVASTKGDPQPSWRIVAQILFRASSTGRRSLSTDSSKQTRQTLARHFYPNTTSWVSDHGDKIIRDTTLPNLCPPAWDFQVVGGSSLPCSLNPNAEETIDWVTVVPVKLIA